MRLLDLTRKAGMPYPKVESRHPEASPPYGWRNGFESMRSATLERDAGGGFAAMTLISIIDDDADVREALAGLMNSRGFTVEAFPSAVDFLARLNVRDTSCLIVDVHMPGMTGIELHRRLVELGYAIPTILITAYPDDGVRARALADGIICYLSKPCEEDALLGCVRSALERTEPGEYHS